MGSLNSARFFSHIEKDALAPAYLLSGEDGFLVDRALGRILARSVGEGARDFNLDFFYARDSRADEIVSQAETLPMMADKRTVVVKEADRLKDVGSIKAYMEDPSPATVLVLVADGAERSREATLAKALGGQGVAVHFYRPSDSDVIRWINRIADEAGYRMEADASAYLRDALGDNLALIEAELGKVFNFAGQKKKVTLGDVCEAIGDFGMPLVFELVDQVADKDTGRALDTLHRLLREGEQPLMVLAMLSRHWRRLIEARERIGMGDGTPDIVKRFRLNFKNRDAFLRQARRLGAPELRSGLVRMAGADKALKGSQLPDRLTMERLVLELSGHLGF